MTIAPTIATGNATAAKDSIPTSTSLSAAMPAISRFELVPMSVTEPASVVMWAIGSRSSRAGTRRVCSSSLAAGMSIATIGVVFMSADATPIGSARRRSACWAVLTVESSRQVTRVITPVAMMPLAITSMAATVMTPPLLSPLKSAAGGATRVIPAMASPVPSARTVGTFPDVIATRVPTTITAAR